MSESESVAVDRIADLERRLAAAERRDAAKVMAISEEIARINRRIDKLEKNSHAPVDWSEELATLEALRDKFLGKAEG